MATFERPAIIAHRGSSLEFPENTFAAFDAALVEGADGIELDLRLTKDEQVIVFHDADLARTGHGPLRVADLTWAELRQLDVGGQTHARFAGQTIPLLADVLERYGSRTTLLLELKVDPDARAAGQILVQRVLEMIQPLAGASLFLLCFDFDMLTYCRSLAPGMRYVLNLQPFGPPHLPPANFEFLEAFAHPIDSLSESFARQVRLWGKPLMTWTCNTEKQLDKAMRLGIEFIMTDKPGWLRAALDR